MKWFYDLKTSVKLIASFIVMALLMAIVGIYGLNGLGTSNSNLKDMYNNQLIAVQQLLMAQSNLNEVRTQVRKLYMTNAESDKQTVRDKITDTQALVQAGLDAFQKTKLSETSASKIDPLLEGWTQYQKRTEQLLALDKSGANDEMKAFIDGDYTTTAQAFMAKLGELVNINVGEAEAARDKGEKSYNSAKITTIVIIALGVLISVMFGYWIAKIISGPIAKVVELLKRIADGDLRHTTDIRTKDEIGILADAANTTVIKLRSTVQSIADSAQNLSAASQEISASTEEVASGSMSQANAAISISELFKDLSSAIHTVAGNTEKAYEISDTTMKKAQDGGEIIRASVDSMSKVEASMARLEEDSNLIGEIIEVIDDIADQTNLLALNAAIEAARAGEQGRGFAVVADEVRKLAERSTEATKQITGIIKGMQQNTKSSVGAVQDCASYSRSTGEAFDGISDLVNKTSHMMSEIAAASEEQSAQTASVLGSVESISNASQQSAAASEETAAAAQSLAVLAEDLQRAVSIFKTV
ncbi:methyl-accepting chemotaxis protein [Cohnella rhizosphaerae]|uniref:Methyl-accepting chemotaxis protein n=1 Tax=Cohnella rhizosphaerae TaxID=1457232 RepID=A0A9X4KV99_9BACL|nr:methyl-accepting chemotaxis protein [Cohnella rhizosphaerae]MDG0811043.1 methyl-accepting chemotaxis protein [Cohnella rhizosphaerae]